MILIRNGVFARYEFKKSSLKFILCLFVLFYCQGNLAQRAYLQIKSDKITDSKIIDSIGYSKKHLNTKSLLDEVNLFSEKLLKNGFLEYSKSELLKANDSTFSIRYDLGKKSKFVHLYIGTNSKLLNIEKDTVKIAISETENFMNSCLLLLESKGYSLAQLKLINHRKENNTLFADLSLIAEKIRTLDDIVINGYDKFPEGHKKNIKRLYSNKVFNKENLKKIYDDFAKLRFVSQPKYPEILFTKDSTKVYVYLEKAKPNTFDGFIGFNNDEKQKLTINGYLDIQLQNILNGGEKFSIVWRSDGKNQKTFNGAIEIPYLFRTPLGLKSQLNIFKQDSIFQNTQTSIDLGYYFNYNTKVFLGYQSTESSDIQNTNSSSLSDFKNSFITSHLDFIHLNGDDYLFPEKSSVYFKIGTGKRNLKTSSSNQVFTLVNLSQNIYLNKKNIFNLRSQNYYLNSNVYIINELYRFGGINSVRGFNENSLQGNIFTSFLTEYRYVANPSLYFHTITDVAYYQDKTSNTKNNLLGLGFGFGLITKNGLFNLIYANGTNKNQTIKLGNSIVHLSFKARF